MNNMNNCKRTTILIVDKQDTYMDYFKGLRKNKFSVKFSKSVLDTTETELEQIDIFFVVLYKPVEFIQLVKLNNQPNVIVASYNKSFLRAFKKVERFKVVDLNERIDFCAILL